MGTGWCVTGLIAFLSSLRARGGILGLCGSWGADGLWQRGSSEGRWGGDLSPPSHDPGALLLTKTPPLAFSSRA